MEVSIPKDNAFPIRELIMKMCSFLINLGKEYKKIYAQKHFSKH